MNKFKLKERNEDTFVCSNTWVPSIRWNLCKFWDLYVNHYPIII